MKKLGMALSGGGFRASLFHLGLVRFLRDAGILSQVTHITAVSGGSVTAAHLVLNWGRYNGSANEFDAAAAELISFVRLDVRNRILRRYPLALPARLPRRLLGRSNRKLTRTGLLEYHYEKYLYGDTSLFELPAAPQLHLLATNLSEGCLCSFHRNGLLMVRRQPGHTFRIDRVHTGLATVAMAVTASSAFPGFFPPLEMTGADVGAANGEFGRQAYTDGGVFDNLGVRMFRCLERHLLADGPLSRDAFVDFPAAVAALKEAGKSNEETPLRRLTQLLVASYHRPDQFQLANGGAAHGAGLQAVAGQVPGVDLAHRLPSPGTWNGDDEDLILSSLSNVMRHYQFQLDPVFVGVKPGEPEAEALLQASRLGGKVLDANDQLWLNGHLLEAAFRPVTGRACFRRLDSGLDGVLVSDVGKRIQVQESGQAGGMIRTSLRATDILMDRVGQLEKETFRDTPGFVFVPIADVVEPVEDPTALHPEVQRQTARMRTDLDRFSMLEISSLVRHGYCVGRKSCRAHPELFGADLPGGAPWDPVPGPRSAAPPAPAAARPDRPSRGPSAPTVESRALQASAVRRIWSTLLDYRDWASYIYVPILVPIITILPYFAVKFYEHSHRVNQIIKSFTQGSPDLEQMSRLLENRPVIFTGEPFEEVQKIADSDFAGFEILQDSRIIDLRNWKPAVSGPSDPSSRVYDYRRMKVLKLADHGDNNLFYFNILPTYLSTAVQFPPQQLQPRLRMGNVESMPSGEKKCRWQAVYDFRSVPDGDLVDLIVECQSPGQFLQFGEDETTMTFRVRVPTAELTMWILMPEQKGYRNFRIVRHETGKSGKVETVKVVTEYLADDSSIIAFKLLSLKAGYTYELQWYYQ